MKKLMLFALLLPLIFASLAGRAQVLPVDSASGKVVYRGTVAAPGQSIEQLFTRAKSYAQVATQAPLIEASTYVISGPVEQQLNGRILRYEVYIKAMPGEYQYELSNFYNKTLPVQYRNAAGMLVTRASDQAPIERVLAHPDGYKKGKPTAVLLAYKKVVAVVAEQAVADLKQGMK